MKFRTILIATTLAAAGLVSGTAQAALYSRGTTEIPYLVYVYDDVLNVTWGTAWGQTDWQLAVDTAASDPTGGYDWRLPTIGELTSLYNSQLNQPSVLGYNLGGFGAGLIWTSEGSVLDTGKAWIVNFSSGSFQIEYGVFIESGASYSVGKYEPLVAIQVVSGDVAAVPEPETYVLMLAGLGLVGAAVKRRRG